VERGRYGHEAETDDPGRMSSNRAPPRVSGSRPIFAVALALAASGCSTALDRNDLHEVRERAAFGNDRFAVVEGQNVHYVEAGEGQPVVLIPGAFSTYRAWNRVLPALAQRHRVIAIDYLGTGDSDKPRAGFEYSVAEQADVVAGLARELGLRAPILVGVSYGSSIALNAAARHPDLASMVVCIEGGPHIRSELLDYSSSLEVFGIPILGDLVLQSLQWGWFDRICSSAIMGHAWERLAPVEQDEIVAIQSSYFDSATRWSTYAIYRSITSEIDFTSELDKVRAPILFLYGGSSKYRAVAEANVALLRSRPLDVETVEIEDGIHDLQLQYPDLVVRLLIQHLDARPAIARIGENGSGSTALLPRSSPRITPLH